MPDDPGVGAARPGVRNHGMERCLAALALAVSLLLAPVGAAPAVAAQDDPRLDRLFARLKATDDAAEGEHLGREIRSIWLESGRKEIDLLMLEGRGFMARGILHSALGNFHSIVKLAPDFAEGYHNRAHVHYLMGNLAASVEDIGRTLAREPRHFLAFAGLGIIYLRLGRERQALMALEKALEINPHLSGTRHEVEELKRKLGGKRI